MAKFAKGNYRKPTGYVRVRLGKRNTRELSTSREIDDELWSILDYYSEIDSIGLDFIKNSGIKNASTKKRIFKHFRSHIRQAKGFYFSAKILPVSSSPLLYYYSFMNLAMARLVIEDPSIINKKLSHGLSYKLKIKKLPFKKQSIKVHKEGVFPLLYNWYFNKNLSIEQINISSLFNYCTDISYECDITGIKENKILYCKYSNCVNHNNKTSWPLIAIYNANEILKYPKMFKSFMSYFEKVKLNQDDYKKIFNISPIYSEGISFFQGPTKNWISNNFPAFNEVCDEVIDILGNTLQFNYTSKDLDYYLTLPYKINKQISLDETISIYLIMFYLSNLVRYNPRYIDYLLDKKESWLINIFIKSCTITFLRCIVSRIININYVFRKL
ncbi:hypothetical protein ES705_00700 [subsurface metagenome]|nr:hypothetical protein [Clostridia bacterium]